MRYFLVICCSISAFFSMAQSFNRAQGTSVIGSVYIPSLQCINVEMISDQTVRFSKAEDFDQGKLLPQFIKATVISNVPYLVSVMASNNYFSSVNTDGNAMPVSVVSLRDNISNQLVSMSPTAKPLLIQKSSKVKTEYTIDAHFNPGWNYAGGQYSTTLIFTLTPQ